MTKENSTSKLSHFDVSRWTDPKVLGGQVVTVVEVYPKRIVALLKANINHKDLLAAISKGSDGKPKPTKDVKGQKTLIRKLVDLPSAHVTKEGNDEYVSSRYVSHTVSYKQKPRQGRLMPQGSLGMTTTSKVVRATLATGIYSDYDFANCHPSFCYQYIKKYPKVLSKNRTLRRYVRHRDDVLKHMEALYGMNRSEAKTLLLRIMNGGSSREEVEAICNSKVGDRFLRDYYDDMQTTISEFHNDMTKLKDEGFDKMKHRGEKFNQEGSTINHFLILQENKSLCAFAQALVERGYKIGALCYDGMLVMNKYDPVEDTFTKIEISNSELKAIEKECCESTGFKVTIVNKDLADPIDMDDWGFSDGDNDVPDDDKFVSDFLKSARGAGTVKVFTSKQVFFYSDTTRLWRKVSNHADLGEHITNVLKDYYEDEITDTEQLTKIKSALGMLKTKKTLGELVVSKDIRQNVEDIQLFNRSCEYLLPVSGGQVIDMKTLIVSERKAEHLFTFELDKTYLPDNDVKDVHDLFQTFMTYKTEDGKTVVDYEQLESLELALGYSMTASVEERAFFVLLGATKAGKSTCFNLVRAGMKHTGMCRSINSSLICDPDMNGIHAEHEALEAGLRFAYCSEFSRKMEINEVTLKKLTGDDDIDFRPMRDTNREYKCVAKIWLSTNEIPKMDSSSGALMSRFVVFNFRNDFSNSTHADNEKLKSFRNERSNEVFTYLINQAHRYIKKQTIPICPSMQALKQEIIRELDPLVDFSETLTEVKSLADLEAMTNKQLGEALSKGELYTPIDMWKTYMEYCDERDVRSRLPQRSFQMKILKLMTSKRNVDIVSDGTRYRKAYGYVKDPKIYKPSGFGRMSGK